MSIPLTATGNSSAASNTGAVADTGKTKDDVSAGSAVAKAKAELNVSIVQASLTVSIKSGNDALSLVYKSAITNINEALKSDFGDNAIQNAASQDNSPEATADRIVSLSTAFYSAYKDQHPGVDEATSRQNFVDTIRKGVEQGFKEAKDILGGLKVLQGDVASNIDKTYDLVQKGLAAFLANTDAQAATSGSAAGGTTVKATVSPVIDKQTATA